MKIIYAVYCGINFSLSDDLLNSLYSNNSVETVYRGIIPIFLHTTGLSVLN